MQFLWKKLYKELSNNRVPNDRSWREIAREGHFSSSLFTRISQGKAISVINLIRVLSACGYEADLSKFVKVID